MTLAQALALARQMGVARLDAQLLLGHILQRPRAWVMAHDDEALDAESRDRFQRALQLRQDGVPLAYLIGTREFHGLELAVTRDVLVPRPDTELLVDWALECLAGRGGPPAEVIDLGTGSGAVALAIKHAHPDVRMVGSDISPAALAVARCNADRLALDVQWCLGPWWGAVPGRHFDLVVSNPPYISEGDSHLHALRHEPGLALTSGADGLQDLRSLILQAPGHMRTEAWLLVEHGHEQAAEVAELMSSAGLRAIATRRDLAGLPRCTGGQLQP